MPQPPAGPCARLTAARLQSCLACEAVPCSGLLQVPVHPCVVADQGAHISDTRLSGAWPDVCAGVLRAGAALNSGMAAPGRWHEAQVALNGAVTAFLRTFASLVPGRWALPVLYTLLRDLRWASREADRASTAANPSARADKRHTEECARQLNKAFGACAADRNPDMLESRKWGTYAVANMLLATYFSVRWC